MNAAVIFDVDGPLLELTEAEEDCYFSPLESRHGLTDLPRDWDSYPIRNDIEIYREILTRHLKRLPTQAELNAVVSSYMAELQRGVGSGDLNVIAIPGALQLLKRLAQIDGLALGTATANLGAGARIRLTAASMWSYVSAYPGAAEDGGAKSEILASVLNRLDCPRERIVFLGDNLNDLEAGRANGVHFIGFHVDAKRRQRLSDAGAETVSGDHETTWRIIQKRLNLP